MAKKPGPKKGSKQRPRSAAPNKAPAARKGTPQKDAAQKRPASPGQGANKQAAGSRGTPLVKSRGVRNALAATLISAAGALLFWKRRDKGVDKQSSQEERREGSRKASQRSPLPPSGDTDPLVAAGVAGRIGKKQKAGKGTPRRGRKASPVTAPPSAEPSEPPQAPPGAYPDGSPVGDTVGRTSIEGGSDRTE